MKTRKPKFEREQDEIMKMAFLYADMKTVDLALAWWPSKLRVELDRKPTRAEKREQRRLIDLLWQAHSLAQTEGFELARKMFVLKRLRLAFLRTEHGRNPNP